MNQPCPADADPPKVAFALDASMISLSLNLFPWGYYARSRRAALKLHLLLSLRGSLPAWGAITGAHLPEVKMLDHIPAAPGAYYIMDRGYLDFMRLFRLHQAGSFFVARSRRDVKFRVTADDCKGFYVCFLLDEPLFPGSWRRPKTLRQCAPQWGAVTAGGANAKLAMRTKLQAAPTKWAQS